VSQIFGDATIFQQRRSGVSSESVMFTPDYEKQTRRLKIKISKIFGSTNVG